MPAERPQKSLRQMTLTGLPATTSTSEASSKSKSKSKSKSAKANATPRVYTDAVLTIKPEFATLIAKREKNHEYRKYELRDTVERLWLYETAPTSAIRYATTNAPLGRSEAPYSKIRNADYETKTPRRGHGLFRCG